jgi:hypothetical protein
LETSKIYLETKIERQKWKNVRNKIVKIKGVELKSIKYKVCNEIVCGGGGGGGANEKKQRQPSQIIGTL